MSYFCAAQQVWILGTAQDGGFPHIGCLNECLKAHKNPRMARYVTSLALVDPASKKWWLFEASPQVDKQLQYFRELTHSSYPYLPEGIFLTHAHIGHYSGLMFLGREALGAQKVKVYALPKMAAYLQSNGPWSQLVSLGNIDIEALTPEEAFSITDELSLVPFTVPHRDEFSETAGFRVMGSNHEFIFIPDINKWYKWDRNIVEMVQNPKVKYAFIDATFFKDGELPNRPMHEIPHPFVEETMRLFGDEPAHVKAKVKFIHLNHTNPLLFDRNARKLVRKNGFDIAEQGKKYD